MSPNAATTALKTNVSHFRAPLARSIDEGVKMDDAHDAGINAHATAYDFLYHHRQQHRANIDKAGYLIMKADYFV